ncbi:MAG: cytochrome c maturation protein CcmE [Kistimonas sp.]|nr:cytochrome c maturation protein CcmE [Kistimonas sp.]
MKSARRQRLALLFFIVFGAGSALGLMLAALDENANLYLSPAQMRSGEAPVGIRLRGGGLVVEGSVHRDPDSLAVAFQITDGAGTVDVHYKGILPDLFREGQGIVVTGVLDEDGQFRAEEVLAKHDETYMPPEVKSALETASSTRAESASRPSGDPADDSASTPGAGAVL